MVNRSIIFWCIVLLFLTIYFGRDTQDFIQSFYFSCFLLPVAIGTSAFFTHFLVPRYLVHQRYLEFAVYLTYGIVVSLYLTMLVMIISFIVFANYQFRNLNPLTIDPFAMAITLYLIVFVYAFVDQLHTYKQDQSTIRRLQREVPQTTTNITVISERKKAQIPLAELHHIESLGDYVRLHVRYKPPIVTRERISKLQKQLPSQFIRTHRSYIVNQHFITAFTSDHVRLDDITIPISRTFKEAVHGRLADFQ